MQFGNTEIETSLLMELQTLGLAVEVRESHSELYIGTVPGGMDHFRLLRALEILASMRPDEVHVVNGRLRLWWD
jgi:hypothetical protein